MLRQAPLPACFVGRTYADLVCYCLRAGGGGEARAQGAEETSQAGGGGAWGAAAAQLPAGWLPLGLLRKKSENRAWRLPFVAVHPDPSTELTAGDAVFLLRSRGSGPASSAVAGVGWGARREEGR